MKLNSFVFTKEVLWSYSKYMTKFYQESWLSWTKFLSISSRGKFYQEAGTIAVLDKFLAKFYKEP